MYVIVSDHGDRAIADDVENYRVPLLVVGNKLNIMSNTQFYSHLDLPNIILNSLSLSEQQTNRKEIFTVGSSEKWTYGYINNKRDYVFINNAKGTILSRKANVNPNMIKNNFQKYVNEFNMKYGKNKN